MGDAKREGKKRAKEIGEKAQRQTAGGGGQNRAPKKLRRSIADIVRTL